MKIMNKNTLIIFLCFLVFSSCGLMKKNTVTENYFSSAENAKELIEKINSQNISPEWLSLNTKIKVDQNDKQTNLSAQIRVKKDSVIWVSIKAPLGIEVIRTVITPDSVYFMNRLNKTYLIKPISHLNQVIKADISYSQLQDILFASPKITDKKLEFSKTPAYNLKSDKTNYNINPLFFRVEQMELIESEDKKLIINFLDYQLFEEIDNYFFPSKLLVKVYSEERFDAEINYTKIEFNKKSNVSFNISKSYVKID